MALATFVRKIAAEVPSMEEIPLFGNSPPFDWNLFSTLLAERVGVETLTVRSKKQAWLTTREMGEGLGSNWLVIPLTFAPLSSPVYWIMGNSTIKKLTSWLLNGTAKGPALSSEILQEGFYRYLLLQSLDAIAECPPLQNLTPELGEEASLPEEGGFCVEVEISFDKKTCWGRLVLPDSFRKEWVGHFSHLPSEYTPSDLSKQLPLVFGIKTGSFSLSQAEWKQLKPGDFVLLDKGSYDVRKHEGTAHFMLGPTPLFQVKIKQNKLEFLEYAYEEPMEQQAPEAAEESVSPIKELPLQVTVEVARIKMTLDQLTHLTPGNTLEIPIQADQSVSLVVNGQKVGRAELIHLGESFGVRILEVG